MSAGTKSAFPRPKRARGRDKASAGRYKKGRDEATNLREPETA